MTSKSFTILLIVISLSLGFTACSDSPEGDPLAAQGKKLYAANCLSCHPIDPSQPRVGPDLAGLSDKLTASGLDAAAVLEESIREPGKEITEGYQDLMPAAAVLGLGDEEISALISYLENLSDEHVD
ncbi:MAG: cytochrome c [Chloroflexota bacterium]